MNCEVVRRLKLVSAAILAMKLDKEIKSFDISRQPQYHKIENLRVTRLPYSPCNKESKDIQEELAAPITTTSDSGERYPFP